LSIKPSISLTNGFINIIKIKLPLNSLHYELLPSLLHLVSGTLADDRSHQALGILLMEN